MSNSAHIRAARSRLLWGHSVHGVAAPAFHGPGPESHRRGHPTAHDFHSGGRKVFEVAMKVLQGGQLQAEQTFLLVRWQAGQPDAEPGGFKAMLCRHHREVVWLRHSNLTGCGQFGDSCDLCEGRPLMRA